MTLPADSKLDALIAEKVFKKKVVSLDGSSSYRKKGETYQSVLIEGFE